MFSKDEDRMVSLGFSSVNEGFEEGVSQALNVLTEIGTGYLNEGRSRKLKKR